VIVDVSYHHTVRGSCNHPHERFEKANSIDSMTSWSVSLE
jgi:hypothetical protein